LQAGGSLRQALRGALVGAPLPICACGVLPVAHALRSRGAGAAFVVAFLLATPELGVESLLLTGRFLGWEFALLRLLGALLLAITAAVVVGRVLASRVEPPPAPASDLELGTGESGWQRALSQLDELFVHILPYTMVGLLAAAYAEVALDADALNGLAYGWLDVLVVTLVSVPVYVCAASATPLAAVLVAKGLSPGAALVGLLLGPATNVATLGFMRASFGLRATLGATLTAVAVTWVLAFGVNATSLIPAVALEDEAAHAHGALSYVALGLLLAWALRSVYLHGVDALFEGLRLNQGGAAHRRDHHGHEAHGHAHGGHGHAHGDHHGGHGH
jgi:uncharacterized membrane protein YraQ (UPF0718 family)